MSNNARRQHARNALALAAWVFWSGKVQVGPDKPDLVTMLLLLPIDIIGREYPEESEIREDGVLFQAER